MAVTNSIIRIYGNAALTDLVTTVTDGPDTELDVTGLSPGTKYWATAQVTADGLTSEESSPYIFYTLPYIEFTGTMHTGTDWFSSLLAHTTTDVGISRWGIAYSVNEDFSDPVYVSVKPMPSQEVKVSGLEQNTTYYARAFVTDVFGRTWVNPDTVTVSTAADAPTIEWYGVIAIGNTSFSASINVTSEIPLTSVVCEYDEGGSHVTINLSSTTGVQPVSLSNLKPNTEYRVVCTATNASGSAHTSAAVFTTGEVDVSIECGVGSVDPSTNIISVDSKFHYDSSIVTLVGHYVDLYENDSHEGTPFEEVSGGAVTPVTLNLGHADPDETYYVFSHAVYMIGSDPTEYEAWSEPVKVLTYSLFKFTNVKPADTWAEARYAVAGNYGGTEIQYSTDGVNWLPVPSGGGDIREGVTIIDLTPNTTYYLRGRCKSAAGWSGWDETTFTTEADSGHEADEVDITSVDYITETTATFTVTIS